MARPSNMRHAFSRVPRAEIPRSRFQRNNNHKTTGNTGFLIPVYREEVYPGETHNLRVTFLGRLATLLHPIMDNLFVDSFFFFVPNRLLWDNWQKFCGEQENPGDSTDYVIPTMTAPSGGYTEESLEDYFGLPTKVEGLKYISLYHRAYQLIYNEWFRDQNLQNSVPLDTGDGPDDPANFKLLRRGKRHDYFTSCLPWPQKGPSVPLPLGESAPITGFGKLDQTYSDRSGNTIYETGRSSSTSYASSAPVGEASAARFFDVEEDPNNPGYPGIYADLTRATAATVNAQRQAFQIQKIYERDARGGTRYREILLAHFGVSSPDARLQRPEYIGGGSTPLSVQTVAQTSASETGSPQANLAAFGVMTAGGHGFTKSFTEHGIILGLICVRADLNYQQGLDREFSRQTRFDYYWPALAHLGEQAVLSQEIYADGTGDETEGTGDFAVFGYQERYGELRYKRSMITGKFRSNAAQPLDSWHLAQNFATRPVLGDAFIEENPPTDRVIAVTDESHFIMDSFFSVSSARPMPLYGVPGLIDHF